MLNSRCVTEREVRHTLFSVRRDSFKPHYLPQFSLSLRESLLIRISEVWRTCRSTESDSLVILRLQEKDKVGGELITHCQKEKSRESTWIGRDR